MPWDARNPISSDANGFSKMCCKRSRDFGRAIVLAEKKHTIVMRFADTNILLYAISTSREERPKSQIAPASGCRRSGLVGPGFARILCPIYAFQEVWRAESRQAVLLVESFLRFPVQEISVGLLAAALDAKERFRVSYWDAAILEAARAQGCHTVLSEDLNHGQDYDGLRVENPFHAVG